MRSIKLTGREATVVRAIGFAEPVAGTDIIDYTRMQPEDLADTLNSLMSAGFVESTPYYEQVELDAVSATAFEMNPAYVHDIKTALRR